MIPTDVLTDELRPAPYNPRRISDRQRSELAESIRTLGMVLPVIANAGDMTIVAGHQRTSVARELGMPMLPAMLVEDITKGDEMSFNQLHNGIESTGGCSAEVCCDGLRDSCFSEVPCGAFRVSETPDAPRVAAMTRLMMRYGNVLSCVVTDGYVACMPEYVKACQVMRMPVNCYVVPDRLADAARRYLSEGYGTYSYDGLRRDTYVQGLAQLRREPGRRDRKAWRSVLYEDMVIPALRHGQSVLDFGCGKGAYVDLLRRRGYDAIGVEFYHNNGQCIDVGAGERQIDALVAHLMTAGRFDVVVCDSVLNSVDSREAESAVMGCLNAFCKPGGTVYVSGRPREDAERHMTASRCTYDRKNFISFLDADGFTAQYRKGHWYFQRYHTERQVHELAETHGFKVMRYVDIGNSWKAELVKVGEMDAMAAVGFEFSLPLPKGRRYDRDDEVMEALSRAISAEAGLS